MEIKSKPHLIAQQIKECVLSGKFKQGSKLPPLLKLANILNVNKNTVIKAYKLLEKEKTISRCPRSGVYVNTPDKTVSPGKTDVLHETFVEHIVPEKCIEEKIADAIINRVVTGFYKNREFIPQKKELIADFKTTLKTVSKALNRVCKNGLISKYGRSYKVSLPVSNVSGSKKEIVLLGNSSYISDVVINSNKEFLSSFENEIASNRVSLKVLPDYETSKRIAELKKDENVLGFLYFGNWGEQQKDINELTGTKKPVVLYADFDIDYILKDTARIFKFEKNNYQSGESVAEHLTVFGHKNIAYFSAFNDLPWSNIRLNGIHGGMRKFPEKEYKITTYYCRLTDLLPKTTHKIDLQEYLFHKKVAGYKFTHIDPVSLNLHDFEPKNFSFPQMLNGFNSAVRKDGMIRIMCPHFENALKNENITAWVCSNETLASAAFDFLDKKGVAVPDKISLVGIDNNEDCFLKRISTYDFNKNRMGYLAAHCLLGDIPVKKDRTGLVKCEGNFVMRQTLGKAVR